MQWKISQCSAAEASVLEDPAPLKFGFLQGDLLHFVLETNKCQ